MECTMLDGASVVSAGTKMIPAGFTASVPIEDSTIAGTWGDNQPLSDEQANTLALLEQLPESVLSYAIDVPSREEIALLVAFEPELVEAFDQHVLRDMIRQMLDAGVTPAQISGMALRAQWDFALQQLELLRTRRLEEGNPIEGTGLIHPGLDLDTAIGTLGDELGGN
jgi:hypothetical protein